MNTTEIERAAKSMTKHERREFLQQCGWLRIDQGVGPEAWVDPKPRRLTMAIREALRHERRLARRVKR